MNYRFLSLLMLGALVSSFVAHARNSDGEEIPRGEAEAIQRTVGLIRESVIQASKEEGHAHRDAHRKAHGCVKASFEVLPGLNPALSVGVFSKPGVYESLIRFSNGSGKSADDHEGDGRGMAIKLLGVPGKKLLSDEEDATTQDFVMINHPVFFVRDAEDYVSFQESLSAGRPWMFFLNPLHLFHETKIVRAIAAKKVTNPLNSAYWSETPYKLGKFQMKYAVSPCFGQAFKDRSDSNNLLRENMESHLSMKEACFDFGVQIRTNERTQPIEDPTIEWDEREAPYYSVARLKIPMQQPEQGEFCEVLSFSPWHSLPEHRPLGGISRVRLDVYREVSKLRHELNGQKREEP